jgi:hypothetical protein
MAIIKPNNNTISAITALPGAIATGKVLQVVSATMSSNQVISSETATDLSGFAASITPSSTSNKILIIANAFANVTSTNQGYGFFILRGSTQIYASAANYIGYASATIRRSDTFIHLDSPSSTSSLTYKCQAREYVEAQGNIEFSEQARSSITLMEIVG